MLFREQTTSKSLDYSQFERSTVQLNEAGQGFAMRDPTVVWTDTAKYRERVRKLYFECPVSRRCIDIRADRMAAVPVIKTAGNTDIDVLLQSPNTLDHQTLGSALREWEKELCLGGDLWLLLDRSIPKRPQLFTLRQDFIKWDKRKGIAVYDPADPQSMGSCPQYRFTMANGQCVKIEERHGNSWVQINAELFHIMYSNPLSSSEGSGAGDAVMRLVDAYVSAHTLIALRFQNPMIPGYAKAPNIQSGHEMAKFKAQMEALNATGQLQVLANGADFIKNAFDFQQLDITKILDQLTRDIALGFGVSSVFMNLQGEATFANQRTTDRQFYTSWLKGEANWLIGELQQRLRVAYADPKITLEIDETRIAYLQDDKAERSKRMKELGAFTINEIRAVEGYEPIPEGDALAGGAAPSMSPDARSQAQSDGQMGREVSINADTSAKTQNQP